MIVSLYGRVGINSYKNRDGDFFAHLTFHVNAIKILGRAKNVSDAGANEGAPVPKDDFPF